MSSFFLASWCKVREGVRQLLVFPLRFFGYLVGVAASLLWSTWILIVLTLAVVGAKGKGSILILVSGTMRSWSRMQLLSDSCPVLRQMSVMVFVAGLILSSFISCARRRFNKSVCRRSAHMDAAALYLHTVDTAAGLFKD